MDCSHSDNLVVGCVNGWQLLPYLLVVVGSHERIRIYGFVVRCVQRAKRATRHRTKQHIITEGILPCVI